MATEIRGGRLQKGLAGIKNAVKIQCQEGNWNHDPYMHGLANGLLFAEACLENREPRYLETPPIWGFQKNPIKDLPPIEAEQSPLAVDPA